MQEFSEPSQTQKPNSLWASTGGYFNGGPLGAAESHHRAMETDQLSRSPLVGQAGRKSGSRWMRLPRPRLTGCPRQIIATNGLDLGAPNSSGFPLGASTSNASTV